MGIWKDEALQARYTIIGPTGWIGRAALAWLHQLLGPSWRDQVICYGSSEREVEGTDGKPLQIMDLARIDSAHLDASIVLHLAFLTKDKTPAMSDANFFAANTRIDELVVAALKTCAPRGVFVASSGAARDVANGSSRNLYGITKLLQEDRFETLAREHEARVMIGRIYNIAGPHINKVDLYALSSFARQALLHKRIKIEASIPVFRSFLHVYDLIQLIIADLLGPPNSSDVTLDLCGPEVLEMDQIASEVAKQLDLPQHAISRPRIDYSRTSAYLGNPCPALTLSHQHGIPLLHFSKQVADTIQQVARTC